MAKKHRLSARELVDAVVDPGTFRSWDAPPLEPAVADGAAYAAELEAAREKSGVDESVITGEGLVRGRRVVLLACEFRFLAGSIGSASAERLVQAIERATAEGLPLLAGPASGGTRMQEGTLAFLSMVKISAALAEHRAAGHPILVYLRHPTTGGVLASWGSLGHVTVAEPGALIGFLGPRVYEALYSRPFPEGVQTGENMYRHGLIDAVLPPEKIADTVDKALAVLMAPRDTLADVSEPAQEDIPDVPAWESITRSRNPDRPGARDLLRYGASNVLPLNGTGEGENDPGLVLALAKFGDAPCVFLGQDRRGQSKYAPMGPGALREARRGMRMSRELGLPLITVIDTPGAALSQEAEEGGMAGEIARSMTDLVMLESPTVSVLIGEGTGGGALAMVPADRVLCAQNGWLSPLPPEGASVIVHRNTDRAAEMAESQGVRSLDLLRDGVVDHVVAERPDAAEEPVEFCRRLAAMLQYEIVTLLRQPQRQRFAGRLRRYRALGMRDAAQ
ncbi:carboxyl transferase domain-containing protein [Spelaeicoccus albus]|uniref:Acetyl-CoA carboxylase carboxyl transferase subunit beta n=1 Tax=Spelaeicoccus albus TaxID=1280376 RepID=A0A7Z0D497_9MICO|nr:carboxyl transferase domain-containing protein [Spelaeicoccus albus]NYI68589.1 acetyl-CoA carboxylase carboxyl transferase subunit beta [Spelaeicoccus albus]